MVSKRLLFEALCLLSAFYSLLSCQSVPDVPARPLLTTTWDTVGRNYRLLLPGDSILISADLASQTQNNTLYINTFRETLPFVEYAGPDSDFVYQASIPISQKVTTGYSHTLAIPDGLRPGYYHLITRAKDNDGRFSDSIKSSFFLNRFEYPVLIMRYPLANGSKTTLVRDTARLNITAAGVNMEYLEFQWFDSTNTTALSTPVFRFLRGFTGTKFLDTVLTTRGIAQNRLNLKVTLRETDEREMLYWLPFKKAL